MFRAPLFVALIFAGLTGNAVSTGPPVHPAPDSPEWDFSLHS